MEEAFYKILEQKLDKMTRKTRLYLILKEKLSEKGYWKKKKRGNFKKGLEKMSLKRAYPDVSASLISPKTKNQNNDYIGQDGFPDY